MNAKSSNAFDTWTQNRNLVQFFSKYATPDRIMCT